MDAPGSSQGISPYQSGLETVARPAWRRSRCRRTKREREPRHRIRGLQNGLGIDEHVLARGSRSSRKKISPVNGKAQQSFGLNAAQAPGSLTHAAGRACGRDVGNGKGCNQAGDRQDGQVRGASELVTGGLQEKASGCRALRMAAKVTSQQAVAGGERSCGSTRGECRIRRAEERAVHAHPA